MKKNIVFAFSGQGSQYENMAKEFFDNDPVFTQWLRKLESIFRDTIHESLLDKVYQSDITHAFSRTLYTHPAIFGIEYALVKSLEAKGVHPDYVIGASLGEFAAAATAGVLSFEDAALCVIKQALSIEKHCSHGGMLAIVAPPRVFFENKSLCENCTLAGINFENHFVVSGTLENLNIAEIFLRKNHITSARLEVSHAFHSDLIDPAMPEFKNFLQGKTFSPAKVPIYSCLNGGEIHNISGEHLWDIVRKPIRFSETLTSLESKGENIYIDLGPSGTLAGFIKRNHPKTSRAEIYSVLTPLGRNLENFDTITRNYSDNHSIIISPLPK